MSTVIFNIIWMCFKFQAWESFKGYNWMSRNSRERPIYSCNHGTRNARQPTNAGGLYSTCKCNRQYSRWSGLSVTSTQWVHEERTDRLDWCKFLWWMKSPDFKLSTVLIHMLVGFLSHICNCSKPSCFQSLKSQVDEELQTHLQIFSDHQEEDFEEYSHRYDNTRMEFEYPLPDLLHCSPK